MVPKIMTESYTINATDSHFININYKHNRDSKPKGADGKSKAEVDLGEKSTLEFLRHNTNENLILVIASFDVSINADLFTLNLSVEIKLEINSTSNHHEIVKLIENEFDHLDGNAFYASIHAIDKKIIELMDLTPNQVRNNFGFLKTYFELNEKR